MKPIDALLPNSSVPSRDKAETSGNLLLKKQSNQSEEVVSEGISDAECVRRIHEGEIAAFEILVRRHQKTIFNLLYRMLGDYDEAAEISQEAFLSAYRSIGQFRGDANFSTWLYRIALNHASTRRRSLAKWQQRTVPIETTETVSERDIDPAENVEQKEIQEQVQRALKGLEPDDAAIILLKDLQDVSYEEVARVLAVPVGTVKSRLHRARRALKARLAPYFNARGTRK
jgi:RNA polymerase sigma-70 factor, ECF subfamily